MAELPENLKGFEGLFRPADYVAPQESLADTLILERPLPTEPLAARARRVGRSVLHGMWRSPRTRRYGLGLGLGSAAVATGIAVAFLTPHSEEAAQAQPSETLIIKPNTSLQPAQKLPESPRMAPVADPSNIPTSLPSWEITPTSVILAAPEISASKPPKATASHTKSPPATPAPSWSTMYPTGAPSSETVSPSGPATETQNPPSSTPTMPLQTSESTSGTFSETPPTFLSPPLGG
ncbi:MAG TPA: hypothetical protein VJ843_03285 [Candidatus Saccharimonadales bacterium]|nr:hypothetical protein [Candidatus Saccharimonadales bacterium]